MPADLGQQIQAALGVPAMEVTSSEVILVSLVDDDTGSISGFGNEQAVMDGHNTVLDALGESKERDAIFVHASLLYGGLLHAFVPLERATRLTRANYIANAPCTPLYDRTFELLATVLAKTQEFRDQNVTVRTASLIVTDGEDNASKRGPDKVAQLVADLLKQECHIIAAMGIQGGTDFRQIFQEMGLRDEWILTPRNIPTEIRRAFGVFSRSSVRASQSAQAFSQVAQAGAGWTD